VAERSNYVFAFIMVLVIPVTDNWS